MKIKNNFLGLDLGEKTLGIAFSEFGILASNLKTIYFNSHKYEELFQPLKKIVEEHNIKIIILGLPKHMNNDLGIKAKISFNFQKKIISWFNFIKVVLWDERLSTQQALQILLNKNSKKKKIKLKDEISAMVILQSFLNYYQNSHLY
ncbi:Holliday junction resolvase RuvX [Candidatus Phytoplasma oryzae]|nr:Holliday junction resolvase RuvX [Candidatus Phytoplasma oryzae]